jgi:ribonuclease HI
MPRLQQHDNVRDLIMSLCSAEDTDTTGLFAMMVWVLWHNRNNKVWNDTSELGRALGVKTRHLWEEWSAVHQVQNQHNSALQQHHNVRWEKPEQEWMKCNVDAALHSDLNKTSFGWCLRDHTGCFIMAETSWMDGRCSTVEGESIALLKAFQTIVQKGFSHVILEMDSKNVVDAVHHLRSSGSEFSFIISNIINILSCNQNFMVKFIKRQANMIAQTLARAPISWSHRCIFETLPICITPLLNNNKMI